MNQTTADPTLTLSAAIDAIAMIDNNMVILQSKVNALEAERALLMVEIRKCMEVANLTEAAGNAARAKITEATVYNVSAEAGGWPALWERIRTTGEFDLLQKRLSSRAVRERFDAGDALPGVRPVTITTIKVTLK
jgi:hypothetical protein